MALLTDLYKKYAPVVAKAARETGQFAQAIAAPAQGPLNLVREVPALAYGAAGSVTPGHSFQSNVRQFDRAVPEASFATRAADALANKKVLPPAARPIAAIGNLAGQFAVPVPGVGEVKALEGLSAVPKLAAYSGIRGLEGYGFGAGSSLAQGSGLSEANRSGLQGAALGSAGNALLSPKLTAGALNDVRKGVSTYADTLAHQGNYAKAASLLDKEVGPLASKVAKDGTPIFDYKAGPTTDSVTLPIPQARKAISSGKVPDQAINEPGAFKQYEKGTVTFQKDPRTGEVLSISSDSPAFKAEIKQAAKTPMVSRPDYSAFEGKKASLADPSFSPATMQGAQFRSKPGNPFKMDIYGKAPEAPYQLPKEPGTPVAPEDYFKGAKQAQDRQGNRVKSLRDTATEQFVDPYAAIKGSDSYVKLNTEPNKAAYQLGETLKAHNEALSTLKGPKETQAYERYRQLQTLMDNRNRGLPTPLNEQEIEQGLTSIRAKIGDQAFGRVQQAADKTGQIHSGLLDSLPGITPETKAQMLAANPNYAPLRAIREDLPPAGKGIPGAKPINQVNKSSLKGRTGFEGFYRPDQVNVERETFAQLHNAVSKQRIVDQLAHEYGAEIGTRDTENPFLPGASGKDLSRQVPPGMVELPARTSDGKIYAVPEKIAQYVTDAEKHGTNLANQALGNVNKVFRAGATTGRIPFIVTNPQGDLLNYAVNRERFPIASRSGNGKISLKDEISALPKALSSSFQEAFGKIDALSRMQKEAGGEFGGAFGSLLKEIPVPTSTLGPGGKVLHAAAEAVSLPYNAISALGSFTERIPRRAEFYRNLQAGKPESEAALAGLDVTANFGRFGSKMREVNQLIPFLNANVQGNYSTYQAFRKSPLTFLARSGAYVVAPTAALSLYNKATGRDDLVDEKTKEDYLYFILPQNTRNSAGQTVPVLLKFRKKEFPGGLSELVRNLVDGNSPLDLKDAPKNLASNAINTLVPPLVKAPLEAMANYDTYTERPLVPQGKQGLLPAYQSSPYTSDTFRKVGEILNVSPAKAEQFAKDLFPAISQVTDLTDPLARPQDAKPADRRTALEKIASYLPLVGVPRGDTKTANAIYDALQNMSQEDATQNYLIKQAYQSGDQAKLSQLTQGKTAAQVQGLLQGADASQAKLGMSPTEQALSSATPQQQYRLRQSGVVAPTAAPTVRAPGNLPNGIRQISGDKYAYTDDAGTVKVVKSLQLAKVALAKEKVASGEAKQVQLDDTLVTTDDSGNVVTKSLAAIKEQAAQQQYLLDTQQAKADGNYQGWLAAQKSQYERLAGQLQKADPVADQAKAIQLQNQLQDIVAQAKKYQSYGGAFSKPKAPKKPKKVAIRKPRKVSVPKYTLPKVIKPKRIR